MWCTQVLVAAPSNVAVDQLAERIALTGLKVVRMMAKSREDVASSVESLTLHYQAWHLFPLPCICHLGQRLNHTQSNGDSGGC